MGRVEGKKCVVLGGAGGIGSAISLGLALEGGRVAVLDRDEAAGAKVVAEIVDKGAEARFWPVDVTKYSEMERVFGEAAEYLGGIDVMVNSAGITGSHARAHEATEEDFDKIYAITVKGAWLATKFTVPHMLAAGGGSVVNISSIMGLVGGASLPLYHGTKGAVRLMTKADAISYAPDKIRFNSVHPGPIETSLSLAATASDPLGADEYMRRLLANLPLGRRGEPADIAAGVLYLASDESKFVTGTELVIDGGYTAR
ncbi:SDR family NAD(P)-dependent oxidoreductase [Rhodococcus artemisiae]|uniref:Glucose 1-dehydrogenase n=1 Tax=Rhodococcus artemisiae TaxID=714159 RepID=A0ABU7LDM7_9NOCA|nr:glucose 1-dehydrogenase [Rhodococcus artemisiae]MEE2059007.1 glucose 1-dehydrogenase [Rhodococcus artemisiae]